MQIVSSLVSCVLLCLGFGCPKAVEATQTEVMTRAVSSHEQAARYLPPTAAAPAILTATLTTRERQVLRQAAKLEIIAYIDGESSTYANDLDIVDRPFATTSEVMQLRYERNRVEADTAFLGKWIIVTGRVASFRRSHGKYIGLKLAGGSTIFGRPIASMAAGSSGYLPSLATAQRASLYCKGAGTRWGAATLVDCHPAESWIAPESRRYAETFLTASNQGSLKKLSVTLAMVRIAQVLPDSSACFNEAATKACGAEMDRVTQQRLVQKTTAEQWQALSLKVFGEDLIGEQLKAY